MSEIWPGLNSFHTLVNLLQRLMGATRVTVKGPQDEGTSWSFWGMMLSLGETVPKLLTCGHSLPDFGASRGPRGSEGDGCCNEEALEAKLSWHEPLEEKGAIARACWTCGDLLCSL